MVVLFACMLLVVAIVLSPASYERMDLPNMESLN